MAIVASFGLNVLPKKSPGVPENLVGMKASSIIEGPRAIAQVNKLHGTDIPLVNAVVAEYSHDFNPYHKNDDKVTVWVGKTRDSQAAAELLSRMVQGIQKGGSPFSGLRKLSIEGHEVYQVDGPGGEHFFYSLANQPGVVWLTIQSGNARSVLEEALKSF